MCQQAHYVAQKGNSLPSRYCPYIITIQPSVYITVPTYHAVRGILAKGACYLGESGNDWVNQYGRILVVLKTRILD